jgi:hypothetical protein
MSARAPHQVTVGGNLRFYGRGAKGNRILTEGEIARLYERRQSWTVDRERVLADVIANARFPPQAPLGFIHAFTRPVAQDSGILERAFAALGDHQARHQALLNVIHSTALRGTYGPSLEQAHHFERRGADEWRLSNASEQYDDFSRPGMVQSAVFLNMNLDGRGQLFCGRATDTKRDGDGSSPFIIEIVIAGNVEAFFAVMGKLYEAAGYFGHVDVGVAVTGIQGASSERRNRNFGLRDFHYSSDAFTRTERVAAGELAEPSVVTHRLLRNFYEATTGIIDCNPFAEPGHR